MEKICYSEAKDIIIRDVFVATMLDEEIEFNNKGTLDVAINFQHQNRIKCIQHQNRK